MRRAGDKENKRDEERGWGGEEKRSIYLDKLCNKYEICSLSSGWKYLTG